MDVPDKQILPGAGGDLADEDTQPSGEFARERLSAVEEASARPAVSGVTSPPADPMIGKVLDNRYRIVQLLARGGMGRVYRAEQAPLNRIVALKVLDIGGDDAADEEFRDRFVREAGACARLTHPNTIRIFDFGRTWDDVYYIAMEYLEGRNLHQVIRADAPLAPARVIHLATQMCGSLREAHRLGLIHRDLKPSNVMVLGRADEGEFVKVLDFGLVKELRNESELTRTDSVVGSPSYMSPEQIRAEKVDQRSDLYALGVVMYACLTGKTPFSGVNTVNVLMAHLSNPPPSIREARAASDVGALLEWIVLTCLAKDAADRFATVEELRRALVLAAAEAGGADVPLPRLQEGRLVLDDVGWATPTPGQQTSPSLVSRSGRPPLAPPVDGPRSSPFVLPPAEADLPVEAIEVRPTPHRQTFPWVAALVMLAGAVMGVVLLLGWMLLRPAGPPSPASSASPSATSTAPSVPSPPVSPAGEGPAGDGGPGDAAPGDAGPADAGPADAGAAGGAAEAAGADASAPPRPPPRRTPPAPRALVAPSTPPLAPAPAATPPTTAPPAAVPATSAPPAAASERPSTDLRDPWKDR